MRSLLLLCFAVVACSRPCDQLQSRAQSCGFLTAPAAEAGGQCAVREQDLGVATLESLELCVAELACDDHTGLVACAESYAVEAQEPGEPCRELEGWAYACGLDFDTVTSGCAGIAAQPGANVRTYVDCMMAGGCFVDAEDERFGSCGGLGFGTVDPQVAQGCQLAIARAQQCGDPADLARCFTASVGRTPPSFLAMSQCLVGVACGAASEEAACEQELVWVDGGDAAAACTDLVAKLDECGGNLQGLPFGDNPTLCISVAFGFPSEDFTAYAACIDASDCDDVQAQAGCGNILVATDPAP